MPSEIASVRALDACGLTAVSRRRQRSPMPPLCTRSFRTRPSMRLLEGVYDGSMTYGDLPARRFRAGDV